MRGVAPEPSNAQGQKPRIYLHIGAMKTGTSFLQRLMMINREALDEQGFLFPGEKWSRQSKAVRDVMYDKADPRGDNRGMWDEVCAEMLAYPGEASILSMEFMSHADSELAAKIVGSFPDVEVHIILTVRDARTALPAQWQTNCRNGGTTPWPNFVRGARKVVRGEPAPGKGAKLFDRTQNIPRILDAWLPLVGPERFHVVTVPPRGSDPRLLWERFASVLGVDPQVAPVLPDRHNPSIGLPSSELVRLINLELPEVPRLSYWRIMKTRVSRDILGERIKLEPSVQLSRAGLATAGRWNGVVRQAIAASGVHVVGSLDDLSVGPADEAAPKTLPAPTDAELLAAASTARTGLIELIGEFRSKLGRIPDTEEFATVEEPTAVDVAVKELVGLVLIVMELDRELMAEDQAATGV